MRITGFAGIDPDGVFSSDYGRPRSSFGFAEQAVREDLADHIGSKGFRFHDRSAKLALVASKHCLSASKVLERHSATDVNVVVGSDGALQSQHEVVLEAMKDPKFMNPKSYPNCGCNVIAGQVSLMFGLRGESTVVSSRYRSGIDALIYALRKLKVGNSPLLVAAGEALSEAREFRDGRNRESTQGPRIEAAVAFVVEKPRDGEGSGGGHIVRGFEQSVQAPDSDWREVAGRFLAGLGLALGQTDYVYGNEGELRIACFSREEKNCFDAFGATRLLGLAQMLGMPGRNGRSTLIVERDRTGAYSMVALTSKDGGFKGD